MTETQTPAGQGKLALAGRFLADALTGGLFRDLAGSKTIPLRPHELPAGLKCLRAEDLICQTAGPDGVIRATRGYHLYELRQGQTAFRRIAHLPCPLGKPWLGHFQKLREYVHRSDFVDAIPLRGGAELVFSGGWVYRRPAGGRDYQRVLALRYWGPGVGRGVRPLGITQTGDGSVFFGEYARNNENLAVRIYASRDDGATWRVAHEFPAGCIRHVHALQEDPHTGWLWVCTGDANDKSFVAYSTDGGATFNRIGTGSQLWRVCRLIFTPTHVCWPTDTNLPRERGVVRWDRATGESQLVSLTDGPALGATRLAGGTWVAGTDREGLTGQQWFYNSPQEYHVTEPDEYPSLWISPDGLAWKRLKVARWRNLGKPIFGIPQIALGDGAPRLVVTCMTMEGYDNCLLVIDEADLLAWFRQQA